MKKLIFALAFAVLFATPVFAVDLNAMIDDDVTNATNSREFVRHLFGVIDGKCPSAECRGNFKRVRQNYEDIGRELAHVADSVTSLPPKLKNIEAQLNMLVSSELVRAISSAEALFAVGFAKREPAEPSLDHDKGLDLMSGLCARATDKAKCRGSVEKARALISDGLDVAKAAGSSFAEHGFTDVAVGNYLKGAQSLVSGYGLYLSEVVGLVRTKSEELRQKDEKI